MAGGRPRTFDRDKALHAGMLLFWRKGFHATSTAELCEAMGISMPSLYAAFGSKEDLYVEAVQLYMKEIQTNLWSILEADDSARESMRNVLLAAVKEVTDNNAHPVGCLVTLATLDEDMPASVVQAVKKGRRDWLKVIQAHLKKAIETKKLAASTDVVGLTRFFVAMVQSMAIQAHDGAVKADLDRMVETAMSVWPKKVGKL